MSADVFLYNALNEGNNRIRSEIASVDSEISAVNSQISTWQSTIDTNISCKVNVSNMHYELWGLIPTTAEEGGAWTGGVTVCDDVSGHFRCGKSCTWTVPAGVTCARFQIWGAGGNSPGNCCCSWAPMGGTGAYASVIMPVTAGETYTLCAGCAYCCYADASSGTFDHSGCKSYVSGTGLTNFCASGGMWGGICCVMKNRCHYGITVQGYCMGPYSGHCWCSSGAWVCVNPSQQGGCSYDNDTTFGVVATPNQTFYGSATGGTVYGITGQHGMFKAVRFPHCLCIRMPAVYGFESTSQCLYTFNANGQGGCNKRACLGFMQIPAQGGVAAYSCYECNAQGDAGRMGMVCVSYL